jgi:hypothetical protein
MTAMSALGDKSLLDVIERKINRGTRSRDAGIPAHFDEFQTWVT